MAEILSTHLTIDGCDAEVVLSNGQRHVFHFVDGEPADLQAAVDVLETALVVQQKTIEVEAEDGTVV